MVLPVEVVFVFCATLQRSHSTMFKFPRLYTARWRLTACQLLAVSQLEDNRDRTQVLAHGTELLHLEVGTWQKLAAHTTYLGSLLVIGAQNLLFSLFFWGDRQSSVPKAIRVWPINWEIKRHRSTCLTWCQCAECLTLLLRAAWCTALSWCASY